MQRFASSLSPFASSASTRRRRQSAISSFVSVYSRASSQSAIASSHSPGMNRRARHLLALSFFPLPAAARAEDDNHNAKVEKTEAEPKIPVELNADDARATLERRVATTTPSGVPFLETGVFSIGHWE